jgi:hypothetical protein
MYRNFVQSIVLYIILGDSEIINSATKRPDFIAAFMEPFNKWSPQQYKLSLIFISEIVKSSLRTVRFGNAYLIL